MSPRYVVKGKIGAGGLGEVYLATDAQLDRDVALKRVKPPESGSAEAGAARWEASNARLRSRRASFGFPPRSGSALYGQYHWSNDPCPCR